MKTSINDLYTASELLIDVAFRRGDSPESASARRVADWILYVAEQREEFEARKRVEKPRYSSLKSGMQAVWRVRGAQTA